MRAPSTEDPSYLKYKEPTNPYYWRNIYEIVDYGKGRRVLQKWYPSVHYLCGSLFGISDKKDRDGFCKVLRPEMKDRIKIFLEAVDMVIESRNRFAIFKLASFRREVDPCEEVVEVDQRFGQLIIHFHTLSLKPFAKKEWEMLAERLVPFTSLYRWCVFMGERSK